MRWNKPQVGDIKVINKFLLLPKCINDEWRWLEFVSYTKEYKLIKIYTTYPYSVPMWVETKWNN